MRRSITLISVAVTTFTMVIMASVVYGYRVAAKSRSSVAAAPVAPVAMPSPELVAAAVVPSTRMSPEAAAQVAAEFLGRKDLYSVEMADYNGVQAYKVTFSSGDVVYVSLEGKVLGTVPAPMQLANLKPGRRNHDEVGGKGGGGEGGGEHETETEVEGGD